MTLAQFIARRKLTMTCERIAERSDNLTDFGHGARHFRIRISAPSKDPITLEFSQGSAHKEDPTLAEILDCLASDASTIANASSFEDFADEMGYDSDSRKAERIYTACVVQTHNLRYLLGKDALQVLMYDVERL